MRKESKEQDRLRVVEKTILENNKLQIEEIKRKAKANKNSNISSRSRSRSNNRGKFDKDGHYNGGSASNISVI